MTTSENNMNNQDKVFLRYSVHERDETTGLEKYDTQTENIWNADKTHKCPTYVQRTPPCQKSCPSGHDVRSWLNIINGIEKPSGELSKELYAFQRATSSNPFPSIMGRVCPAPCESGCNRSAVETSLGINSIEQFIGDNALESEYAFQQDTPKSGKAVAIVGGGPGGLSAAYFLAGLGHSCTILESSGKLGGMIRYGIPGYRVPEQILDHEINRILDLGIEVKLNTKVGVDVGIESLESDFDAIYWAIGAQQAKSVPIDGMDAPNIVSGVDFLRAFNENRLNHVSKKILVIGGGDTSIDVASVACRLGTSESLPEDQHAENIIKNNAVQVQVDRSECGIPEVLLTSIQSAENMPASQVEIDDAIAEGVQFKTEVGPKEILLDQNGRARGAIFHQLKIENKQFVPVAGTEFEVEADFIVQAIGQIGDVESVANMADKPGLFTVDANYQVMVDRQVKVGHFAGGDILNPHLLTTAIGHSRVAAQSIDDFLNGKELPKRRPKVDVNSFDLFQKLSEFDLLPDQVEEPVWGTAEQNIAIHNFENRAQVEVVPASDLFLGHFKSVERTSRATTKVDTANVLGNFDERRQSLDLDQAVAESSRCMSCGLCFECDNCVIYCPQTAVKRTKKKESTTGRYVETDYSKCIGCHICKDVCPTSYIQMGMGE